MVSNTATVLVQHWFTTDEQHRKSRNHDWSCADQRNRSAVLFVRLKTYKCSRLRATTSEGWSAKHELAMGRVRKLVLFSKQSECTLQNLFFLIILLSGLYVQIHKSNLETVERSQRKNTNVWSADVARILISVWSALKVRFSTGINKRILMLGQSVYVVRFSLLIHYVCLCH